MEDPSILDTHINSENGVNVIRRRALLPMWIKIFLWIFLVMGGFAVLAAIAGLFGVKFNIALYGLSSSDPLSLMGIALTLVFLFKLIVALGLWVEKDWAVNAGIADAVLGIVICVYVVVLHPILFPDDNHTVTTNGNVTSVSFNSFFRLELLALIPYLIKLIKIREKWKMATEA